MKPKFTRKFDGVIYQYHDQFEERADAVDEKKALIDEGHLARFAKDPVYGFYHVYVRVEESEDIQPDEAHEAFDPAPLHEVPQLSSRKPFAPYLSGLDFLKVSLHANIPNDFKELLRVAKEELNDLDDTKNPDAKEASLDFVGDMSLNIQSYGAGKYPYVLKTGDITLLFSNHKSDAQCPNCRIEIGSMSCWHPGWLNMFEQITSWLRGHGVEIVRQKLTEFHITADLLGVEYEQTNFANKDRWSARCQKGSQHFEHWKHSYLSLGKGNMMFRCYSKTGELDPESAKHDFFHNIWREHTGEDVEHVTRLEFQIRRPVIKELKIKSVSDLSQKLNAVWAYCVGDGDENKGWCRFLDRAMTASDRKNKNQQRYDIDQLWELVRSVRFGEGRTFHLLREKTQHLNIELLSKMMAGCGSSLCGGLGLAEEDHEGHIKLACFLLEDQMRRNYSKDPDEYRRKVKTKHNKAEITF